MPKASERYLADLGRIFLTGRKNRGITFTGRNNPM
jgi:hypothetical protein